MTRAQAQQRNRGRAWRTLRRSQVIRSPWFNVVKEDVRLPNGKKLRDFYMVKGSRLVAVVLLDDRENVLVVRQYRHAIRRTTLDLPGGQVEKNESFLQAAKRELQEETGIRVKRWTKMITYFPDSGRKGDRKVLYRGLLNHQGTRRIPHGQREEGIGSMWVPMERLLQQINNGQTVESTLAVGILCLTTTKR